MPLAVSRWLLATERTGAFALFVFVRVRFCSPCSGLFAPLFVRFVRWSPQDCSLTRLRRLDPATPRKYQSRHKCPKGVLKICEQAPISTVAFCTYGVRPLLRSAQSQRSFACSLSLKRTLVLHIGKVARAVGIGYF